MDDDADRRAFEASLRLSAVAPTPTDDLPEAARFALWFTAWCAGRCSLDQARDAVVGCDAAHDLTGIPDQPGTVPLILALGLLRTEGASHADLALPAPGDPLGLAGPPEFNAEALETGQAVLLPDLGLGLVPARTGAGVVWRVLPATGALRQVPDLAEADTGLRAALPRAADVLADLDVARWRPEIADELVALRRRDPVVLPPGTPERVARMVGLAVRCRRIVELALADDGAAVTAREAEERRTALLPLDRAARRALVAACTGHAGR